MDGRNGFQAIRLRWLTNAARVSIGMRPLAAGAVSGGMTCPTPETRDAERSVAADLIQAATPLCIRRDRRHFKPPKQFREFPFERLEFDDLIRIQIGQE